MSIMAMELLKHEEILTFTSIYEDYLKKNDGSSIWLVNTNKLVRFYEGVDGLKTGFTSTAGYCITTTAKRSDMRLLSVVMNAETSDLRSKDTTNMLNYGFNTYKLNVLLNNEKSLGKVHIEKGKIEETEVYLKNNITTLQKQSDEQKKYDYNIIVDNLEAPIKSNEKVGYVEVIDNEGNVIREEDIIIKEEVKKASILDLFGRVVEAISSGNFI